MYGREVASLIDANHEAGEYSIPFNMEKYHVTSGMYFARILVGENLIIRKMIKL